MRNFSFTNHLNKVWMLALVAFMVACSQFEAPGPDDVNLESSEASLSLFDLKALDNAAYGYGYDPYSTFRTVYGNLVDCEDEETYCVSSDNYYYKVDDQAITGAGWGGVRLEYYQNHLGEMKFKFTAYAGNNGKVNIIDGYKIGSAAEISVDETSNLTLTVDLPEGWKACDDFDLDIILSIDSGNKTLTFNTSYVLLALCGDDDDDDDDDDECDEEDFFYEKVNEDPDDYTYLFTYIPCENLSNAVVKFTSPHIKSFVSMDDKVITTVNQGAKSKRGNPTVLVWTGDIPKGGITFEINFTPDCTQTNSDKANVWTDFKVNEVSKKFQWSNIVAADCGKKK
jgi:hypothetical protein